MRPKSQQLQRLGPPAVIVAGAACHAAYLYVATEGWIVDDAYISFRYIENWVAGHGLVFNVGERVEGYTNFLWILLLAAFRAAGLPLLLTARLLGVALTLGAVLLLYRIGVHQLGRRLGWFAAALYAPNHSLMTWSFGGLELPLFLFLLLLRTSGSTRSSDGRAVSLGAVLARLFDQRRSSIERMVSLGLASSRYSYLVPVASSTASRICTKPPELSSPSTTGLSPSSNLFSTVKQALNRSKSERDTACPLTRCRSVDDVPFGG